MATPSTRNLVLLLSSGHTVRIALRGDDLNGNGGPTFRETDALIDEMPAIVVSPFATGGEPGAVVFSYVEDPSLPTYDASDGSMSPPNDHQRITVEGPGTVVQYG